MCAGLIVVIIVISIIMPKEKRVSKLYICRIIESWIHNILLKNKNDEAEFTMRLERQG